MDKVRVGIVGAGFMAQAAHIHCFQLADGCEVLGLASSRPKLREQVAARFGIPRQYDSWAQMARDPDIDAAVVLLPPEFNPDVVCGLLEAGKHVFAEKPMALSLKQAQRMAETAERTERLLMIAYMKRYDPGIERARRFWDEVVVDGGMGEVVCARAWCLLGGNWTANQNRLVPIIRTDEPHVPKPIADLGPEWMPQRILDGAPGFASPWYAFIHVHSHNINLLRYFLGDDYDVLHADFRHKTKVALMDYRPPELGQALVTFEVGAGISAHAFEEGMKIYFQRGWMEIIPPPPLLMQGGARVTIYRDSEVMELTQPLPEWDWSFRRQAQHFIDCVREGRQPRSSGADSVGDLAMAEAIFRCAVDAGTV